MLMVLSVSDTIPTAISKILWNELEAEQSKTRKDLWLRKHYFLKNNAIFISLKKDNVQYFHNSASSEHALLLIVKLRIELSLVLAF